MYDMGKRVNASTDTLVVSIRMTRQLRDALDAEAQRYGISRGAVIRRGCDMVLNTKQAVAQMVTDEVLRTALEFLEEEDG